VCVREKLQAFRGLAKGEWVLGETARMVPAGLETRQLMSTLATKPLSRRFSSVISAPYGISNYIVFADARVTTKWRHWLDRKAWAQNAKTVRCNCKENEHEHCCTFHVSGFYRLNRSTTRKF
jgi:hypothetical protein